MSWSPPVRFEIWPLLGMAGSAHCEKGERHYLSRRLHTCKNDPGFELSYGYAQNGRRYQYMARKALMCWSPVRYDLNRQVPHPQP